MQAVFEPCRQRIIMATRISKGAQNDSHWILFILLPFFSALSAIRNFRAPWAKNIMWAFVVFFGFTFSIGKETMSSGTDSGSDINRYISQLKELYGKSLTVDEMVEYFEDSGEADILRTVIAITVSRFTDNQRILIAIYGFIFGFFFTRNVWYLFERLQGRLKLFSIFLMATFFLLDSFWEINGFRFYTAIHIFIYGLLPYIYEGKKRTLWICASAVLVHFSFFLPNAILLIYLLAGNRSLFYFIFFVSSAFVQQLDLTVFNNFIENNVPELLVDRSAAYRNEDRVSRYRSDDDVVIPESATDVVVVKNWYAKVYAKGLHLSLTIILIFLYVLSIKKIKGIPGLYNAFCFTLLFFAVSNVMASLPSGNRFLTISSMLAASVILLYFQNYSKEQYLYTLMLALSPFFLLFFLVSIRIGLYSIGLQTVIGNPVLGIITDYNLSLNDLIK